RLGFVEPAQGVKRPGLSAGRDRFARQIRRPLLGEDSLSAARDLVGALVLGGILQKFGPLEQCRRERGMVFALMLLAQIENFAEQIVGALPLRLGNAVNSQRLVIVGPENGVFFLINQLTSP